MKKENIDVLILFWILLLIMIFDIVCSIYLSEYVKDAEEKELEKEIVYVESDPEIVEKEKVVTVQVEPEPEFSLTDEEMELMAGIVQAEAGNQDMIGKRLVADVILNRVVDPEFPNTVSEVVYQQNQFAAPMNYTMEDMSAVELECQKRIDSDVLWFRTGHYHNCGEALYQHNAHYFSGERRE